MAKPGISRESKPPGSASASSSPSGSDSRSLPRSRSFSSSSSPSRTLSSRSRSPPPQSRSPTGAARRGHSPQPPSKRASTPPSPTGAARRGHSPPPLSKRASPPPRMSSESTTGQPSQKVTKANWNAVNNKLYIDLAYEEVLKGNRSGMSFTKEGWVNIMNEFNRRTNYSYNLKKFKNHHNRLKDKWRLWDKMMNKSSGFGFDSVLKTITATDEVWDIFLQANPDAAIFRTSPLENLEELKIIFMGSMATGKKMCPNVDRLAQELPHTSQLPPEQTRDDIPRDDEYVPSTQMDAKEQGCQENGDAGSFAVGDIGFPHRRRFESSVSSRRPRKQSRGASIDTYMRMMSKYFEMKMNEHSREEKYDIPTCIKRLNELSGMEKGTPIWMFAIEMLQSEAKRKTFMSIVDDVDECLNWIRFQMGD